MRNEYARMCRDGHEEIGHNDSEHEMCPLCRAIADTRIAVIAERERILDLVSAYYGEWDIARDIRRMDAESEMLPKM